jgi:tetratricopeptide (TPR) repeat protein
MNMRLVACLALAGLVSWPAVAGEVQLWISYHYQGVDTYEAGRYRDAETLFTQAEGETCEEFRLAFTLDGKGMTQFALGQYSDAEAALEKALCLRTEDCGEESRFVPTTLNNLADLHYVAGDMTQVEPLYRRALEINEQDPYSVEVGRSLNGLALLANDAGEAVEAENLLRRAIRIHLMGGRSEHPYMATALINLAALLTNQGRYDEAKPLLRRAEHIQGEVLGDSHPDVAVRLHAQAGLLAATGHIEEAHAAQNRAEEIEARFSELNR